MLASATLLITLVGTLLAAPSPSIAATSEPVGCNVTVLPGQARCFASIHRPTAATTPGAVRSFTTAQDTAHGVTPADIATLYDLPPASETDPPGSGPAVALVEEGDAPELESELATYRTQYDLGACSVASGCLSVVDQQGRTSPLPDADPDWAWETTMDVEAVAAACPACKILVVEADSAYTDDLDAAAATAAASADYVSMSWGSPDDGLRARDVAASERTFSTAGVTFVAATGDFGWHTSIAADDGNPQDDLTCGATRMPSTPGDTHSCTSYPASSTHVVAAGGTMPVLASDGTLAEQVWGDADDDGSPNAGGVSSGCSGWTKMNGAQALNGRARGACGTARGTADISALADGFSMYHHDTDTGRNWWIGAGTSLAAPLLAAMYARAGNHTNPFEIYARATAQPDAFNDITSGIATRGCPTSDRWHLCNAGVGWDGPTGLGTPHGLESLEPYDGPVLADPIPAGYLVRVSAPPAALRPIRHSGKIKVSGKARVHARLKAAYGTFDAGTTSTVTWLVNGKPVAHGKHLRVKKAWLKHRIRYVVTATGAGRTPLSLTSPTVKVKR